MQKKNNNNEIKSNNNENKNNNIKENISNKIINNKDNLNTNENGITPEINENPYDERGAILKFGNNKNSYYDKIIQLEQKDKLNKIRLI